ncbi:hypothetical protein OsJ_26643 [Oryza sativa Japonica Group]|uniref:Uncharacterized protein n=2 Tax=Oryza TaxID=4527 RepID=B9FZX7_ORYSJ|nr:hypothetical protein OsJ_26643 [Oryza sativa Japonica Group]
MVYHSFRAEESGEIYLRSSELDTGKIPASKPVPFRHNTNSNSVPNPGSKTGKSDDYRCEMGTLLSLYLQQECDKHRKEQEEGDSPILLQMTVSVSDIKGADKWSTKADLAGYVC